MTAEFKASELYGRFTDYAVIPLDLPRPPVDIDALRDFVQHYSEKCAFTDNVIRYVVYETRKPVIEGKIEPRGCDPLYGEPMVPDGFVWDPHFERLFPDLTDWFEQLPLRNLYGVSLITQTADILDHLDIAGDENGHSFYRKFHLIEPMYYRIVFCDPADQLVAERSFYVCRDFGGDKIYVRLPPGTAAFAMSSSICYHGADCNPGHYKSTGVVYGDVDPVAHLELLARSLARYSDWAIRFANVGPVEGPGAEFPYPGPPKYLDRTPGAKASRAFTGAGVH